jgi:hypothetical protein
MKSGEILETIVIAIALFAIMPVALWWHTGELGQHRLYFYFLFFMLCILGYITYRRIKRLRAALRASKKPGSGPRVPPFFQ